MGPDLRSLLSDRLVDAPGTALPVWPVPLSDAERIERWRSSGAAALTGRSDGPPLDPPLGLFERIDLIGRQLSALMKATALRMRSRPVEAIDPFVMLALRARHAGLERRSPFSCGGSTKLLRLQDGWMALCLARPSDVESLPALLGIDDSPAEPWAAVERSIISGGTRSVDLLLERAVLLGLAVARMGETPVPSASAPAVVFAPVGARRQAEGTTKPRVVDFSALWAGPLCAHLLGMAGFDVVKVESFDRPDGARFGPPGFYAELHTGQHTGDGERTYDFGDPTDRAAVIELVAGADVVIESSRPRALERLGLTPGRDHVWVSITGHGRNGRSSERIAFGDDAAVAGGLVVDDGSGPCFCADAIADPLTGMVAAWAALAAWQSGSAGLLDVAMARVSAWFAADARQEPISRRPVAARGALGAKGPA